MAVIGSIRRRAGLLIGIVGFSLIAFILGDLLTSNRSFLAGNETDVAVIGGRKVSVQEFEARVKQLEENYKINTGTETVDQNTQDQLREQAWTTLLNEEIMNRQFEKSGIKVSSEELFDMIQGRNPHPQIKEAFKDPQTGQFSSANVIQFLKNMDNDATGKTRAQWVAFEKFILEDRRKEKYNEMIKHGLFTTTEEARLAYMNQGKQATIRFVSLGYETVADSTVSITDDDLRDYYNTHKDEFKQEASRKIEYVTFDVNPSTEDIQNAFVDIEKQIAPFKESTDDSLFSALNSDTKTPVAYYKQGTLSPNVDTVFFNGAAAGTIIGPYEENGSFKLSKLIEIKNIADSIRVSHILIAFTGAERAPAEVTRTKEEAKSRADSLLAVINKDPKQYDEFARLQSDDKVAGEKSGDLEWITKDSPMDPRFKAGAFEIPKGSVEVVESNFGYHLIKVTDMTSAVPQAKVALIDRKISPGSKTFQEAYSKATEFAAKNNTPEAFEKAVKEQGLNKREADNLKETDKFIPGLEAPRAIIQWAYRAKAGEVSKTYDMGNKFVIAHLTQAKEKGVAPFEQAKDLVKGKVIKEKKAKMFEDSFNTQLAKTKSIDDLGTAMNLQVKTAENVNFASSFIANLGVEPKLVGVIFTLKEGQISEPVDGEAGVYVTVVEKFTQPAETKDFTAQKSQATEQLQSRTTYEVFNALKEKANVVDNRGKFY